MFVMVQSLDFAVQTPARVALAGVARSYGQIYDYLPLFNDVALCDLRCLRDRKRGQKEELGEDEVLLS